MSLTTQISALIDETSKVTRWLQSLDQDSPIGATVEFQVLAAHEADYVRHSEILAGATRRQAGLDWYSYDKIQVGAPTNPPPPTYIPSFSIIERWRSVREFTENQWTSVHLNAFKMSVGAFVAGPPILRFIHGSVPSTEVFQTGGLSANRFKNNGDGTVTDTVSGLVWLENANLLRELKRFSLEELGLEQLNQLGLQKLEEEVSWGVALAIANALCSSDKYGLSDGSQRGDWRLANVNEMQSLLDFTRTSGPAVNVNPDVIKNLEVANYWTATSVAAFPALAWYTAMAVGPPVFDLKINKMRMWPVKGVSSRVLQTGQDLCWDMRGNVIPCLNTGQDGEKSKVPVGLALPARRFVVNFRDNGKEEDGTVTDRATGLTWLKNANAFGTLNWIDAKEACSSLCAGQFKWLRDGSKPGDWELPDVNKLRSLEDYGEARPALPAGHPFTNVRESLCWSSTEVASSVSPDHKEPTLARFLYVGIGSCVWDHKGVLCGVWPVKRSRNMQ